MHVLPPHVTTSSCDVFRLSSKRDTERETHKKTDKEDMADRVWVVIRECDDRSRASSSSSSSSSCGSVVSAIDLK